LEHIALSLYGGSKAELPENTRSQVALDDQAPESCPRRASCYMRAPVRLCADFSCPRKSSSSGFTLSACVQLMAWGPPSTTTRRAPLTSFAVRRPEAVMGRIRSASPCMTSVGISMRARSLRKSVYHVRTQATLAVAEAPAARFQLAWTAWSLTRLPNRRSVL